MGEGRLVVFCILSFLAIVGLLYMGYQAGLQVPEDEAVALENALRAEIENATVQELALSIFVNNLYHGLIVALAPGIGMVGIAYVVWSTGYAYGMRVVAWRALGEVSAPTDHVFVAWITHPVVLFELAVYVIALALQVELLWRWREGRLDRSFMKMFLLAELALVALLFIHAIIEASYIVGG
mgnify:CR=1 FL=1